MHISVFKKEIIAELEPIDPAGNYADLTLGAGGHTVEIWNQLKTGNLIAFDIDLGAVSNFILRLNFEFSGLQTKEINQEITEVTDGKKHLFICHRGFERIADTVAELKLGSLSGVIADLGWASEQLDGIEGLAYSGNPEAKLDMRLRSDVNITAADLLNGLYKPELERLFNRNADISGRVLRDLVNGIMNFREHDQIKTVADLLKITNGALAGATTQRGEVVANADVRNLVARVFQALRIAVNLELSTLQSMLTSVFEALAKQGKFAIITFHSGEEKIVNEKITEWVAAGRAQNLILNSPEGYLRPSVAELEVNLRARSAKLFAIEKK